MAYNRKDHLYHKAKSSEFRSRAYFKLEEINKKHRLIKRGDKVVDLGAWPGGWVQYVSRVVGPRGLCVGIDLQEMDPLKASNIKLVTGDVRDVESLETILAHTGGKVDTVISDMSPQLTGIKEADQASSVGLAELALYTSIFLLKEDGAFTAKMFKGAGSEEFVRFAKNCFKKFKREELKTTRNTSKEFYFVGLGFIPDNVNF